MKFRLRGFFPIDHLDEEKSSKFLRVRENRRIGQRRPEQRHRLLRVHGHVVQAVEDAHDHVYVREVGLDKNRFEATHVQGRALDEDDVDDVVADVALSLDLHKKRGRPFIKCRRLAFVLRGCEAAEANKSLVLLLLSFFLLPEI